MRLGLNSHVSDYNPVAHIIEKSILQYPGEDQNLAKDFEKYANNLIQISKEEMIEVYSMIIRNNKILAQAH